MRRVSQMSITIYSNCREATCRHEILVRVTAPPLPQRRFLPALWHRARHLALIIHTALLCIVPFCSRSRPLLVHPTLRTEPHVLRPLRALLHLHILPSLCYSFRRLCYLVLGTHCVRRNSSFFEVQQRGNQRRTGQWSLMEWLRNGQWTLKPRS